MKQTLNLTVLNNAYIHQGILKIEIFQLRGFSENSLRFNKHRPKVLQLQVNLKFLAMQLILIAFHFSGNMDKRIFLFLIVLVAFTVEAKKKILKKKLNQLKGKEREKLK